MDNPLIGTWQLASWENRASDGSRAYPLGPDANGLIGYLRDGHMFVHIAAANRPSYAVNDPRGGSEAEDSAAIKSMISYAGSYEFLGDHVLHHVALASFPNWVGGVQKRYVQFDAGRLCLSTDPIAYDGGQVTAVLWWRRLPTA